MRRLTLAVCTLADLFLAKCASRSGVVPIGPDTFLVSRQAATGFSGSGTLKAEALREAQQYCSERNKVMQVVNTNEAKPPYILGNFPKAEVQFMCLGPNDPELARPKMQKEPDVVIESREGHALPAAEIVPVAIDSDPAGADVFLDGVFVGNTPLPLFAIRAGEHLIELRKSGFTTWSRRILAVHGAPSRVSATLDSAPRSQ